MSNGNFYQSFEVLYRKVTECPIKNLQTACFQMIYVISGNGHLVINGNRLPYRPANLMLLNSNDDHSFDIPSQAEFLLIRFNREYLKENRWKTADHLESLLYYSTHLSGCVINNKADSQLVKSIVDSIRLEIANLNDYDEDLLSNFVNALIVIAARNILRLKPQNVQLNADQRLLDIINYVQTNIYSPEKIRAATISEVFSISETYLGSYFKKQGGETIQHFISNYKLRLIEHRLRFSSMRINEIVSEFGFSDESHLNKFFKNHKKMSLSAFKKQIKLQGNFEKDPAQQFDQTVNV